MFWIYKIFRHLTFLNEDVLLHVSFLKLQLFYYFSFSINVQYEPLCLQCLPFWVWAVFCWANRSASCFVPCGYVSSIFCMAGLICGLAWAKYLGEWEKLRLLENWIRERIVQAWFIFCLWFFCLLSGLCVFVLVFPFLFSQFHSSVYLAVFMSMPTLGPGWDKGALVLLFIWRSFVLAIVSFQGLHLKLRRLSTFKAFHPIGMNHDSPSVCEVQFWRNEDNASGSCKKRMLARYWSWSVDLSSCHA